MIIAFDDERDIDALDRLGRDRRLAQPRDIDEFAPAVCPNSAHILIGHGGSDRTLSLNRFMSRVWSRPLRTVVTILSLLLLTAGAESAEVLERIERFGFATRPKVGAGGFVAIDIYPVVLFRDGSALRDVKALNFSGGLETHRRQNPEQWTQWRLQGDEWQLDTRYGWKALPFKQTYEKLPADFRLNGRYRSVSGTGTMAQGGTQQVTAYSLFQFYSDGRVVRASGAGARTEDAGTLTTQNQAAHRVGQYRIDGLTLTIAYGDRSTERHVLITDPRDPKSAIWLDGVGYAFTK
ncbi:hypothetical protein [Bradyrhizobium roseum]|uniref:hypothetical protein n=1 Tax=Bradyrhizobium roseum TaxID=3056648 RepID=UPI002631E4D5|nr:hypothetical protein [Bradyrhizobium roseus]WKA31433.1 hypothetical protein QUH67_15270 [Bradyrhizobium roseus]